MNYKWKFQPKGNVDAQTAGEFVVKLTAKNGGRVTPRMLLEAARPKRSPLHSCFEWDDSVAAEKYRQQQAQVILVQLVEVHEQKGSKEPLLVRAFVSVEEKEEVHYTTLTRAMTKPQLKRQIIQQVIDAIKALEKKYGHLRELKPVFDALAKVEKRQGQVKHKRRKAS